LIEGFLLSCKVENKSLATISCDFLCPDFTFP